MFEQFFKLKSLPTSFNIAKITPIYKGKGSRSDPSSYRPISTLPLLSKLLEKVIYLKLYGFVESNNLFDSHQHGFRKFRSCQSALSLFLHDLASHLDPPNMKAGVVFVDLRKAFDSVRPLKLLLLFFDIEIPDLILLYLCMYFTSRKFSNKLLDFFSELFDLFMGCPQGGILSPILFSLYINGVGKSLKLAFYWLFADDMSFYLFNTDTSQLKSDLSNILESLNQWFRDKDLTINFDKTKYMIFAKKASQLMEIQDRKSVV